jgi:hypothetical protein
MFRSILNHLRQRYPVEGTIISPHTLLDPIICIVFVFILASVLSHIETVICPELYN